MINLIRNELYKLFHKRGTYIFLIIMLAFVILTNFIYKKYSMNDFVRVDYYGYDYEEAKDYLDNNDLTKDNYEDYVYYETVVATTELLDNYDENWQKEVVVSDGYTAYYDYYLNSYLDNQDSVNNAKNTIDNLIKDLDTDNWQRFVNNRIDSLKLELQSLNEGLRNATRKSNEIDYKKQIELVEKEIELLEYRLKENLPIGGRTYLDDAINTINGTKYEVVDNKYSDEDKYDVSNLLKEYYVNQYILDNKLDVNNNRTSRGLIIEFYSEYYFLILIFFIMIAGAIVSDEYNKGTIKSLLILPYSRAKILFTKFLTIVIMLLFGILTLFVMQFIIGGIFFGFSTLSIPYVTYNVTTESIVTINIFKYFILLTITYLPKLLLLGTLAFSLSTIIGNTAAAISITFCGYIGETIVNAIARSYNVKFLNYFVTTNWNFQEFLFGGHSSFKLSLSHGIIICSIYFIFMLVVSFIVFKKKDIKNI